MLKHFWHISIGLVILFLTSCIKYEDVIVKDVTQVSVNSFTANKIELTATIRVENPNNFKINIVDSDFVLYANSNKIGKAKLKNSVELPKNSDMEHQFKISTTIDEMLGSAVPVVLEALLSRRVDIRINGGVKAQAKWLSKTVPVEFSKSVNL
ncbi:MAG: LEA type 2 family protein [Flavobacteriales bacterium]|nr:LEA type 2 family protein [Flavobacteriales bacterium]